MSPSRTQTNTQTYTQASPHLSEQLIQDSFHSYLRSSLAQAKAERLLDADVLSSAQADLMITGPALCLYFAALRCTTHPPSVPLPRGTTPGSKTGSSPPIDLSFNNCPPVFAHFLRVWADTVPKIQSLIPEHQHDLARVICGLDPVSQPLNIAINGIAADLRAVAIEISQRRSFQDRYADDLQAALDAGEGGGGRGAGGRGGGGGGGGGGEGRRARKVSFVPPPMYEEVPTPQPSPRPSPIPSPRHSIQADRPVSPTPPNINRNKNLPTVPIPSRPQTSDFLSPTLSPTSSTFSRRSATSTILTPDTPAIDFIRETLYASLGDVLERLPSLRRLLKRDPPRAYFASVAFAILDVATTSITTDGTAIVGVLGTPLYLDECPPELKPFMKEMIDIGLRSREIEDADNQVAMERAQRGEDERDSPVPIMERVRVILELGVGHERRRSSGTEREGNQRRKKRGESGSSIEGRAVTFANRINALSLSMTKLRPFQERQEFVFKILAGIGS